MPLKKTLRLFVLLLSLSTFVFSLSQVFKYWKYEDSLQDLDMLVNASVSAETLEHHIQVAIDENEYDEAKSYLAIARKNQFSLNYQDFQKQLEEKDTKLNRIVNQASQFATGFAKGEASNTAGIAGAVSADFTVVGDVRDLHKEYQNFEAGKPVNDLIVVLSGTGIGLTALTVSSLGSTAPVKAGTSLMKVGVKTQRLTKGFQKQLLRQGRKVFDWQMFTRLAKQDKSLTNIRRSAKVAYKPQALEPLKAMAKSVSKIRKSSSTADTLHLLKYVENSDDLRRLEKVAIKHGADTKGYMKLLGKGAIRTVRVLRKTAELLWSIISSIVSGLISIGLFVTRRLI